MDKRTETFTRNTLLESMLKDISNDLQPAEEGVIAQYRDAAPSFPVVLVMGPLRSGTTLFMQWLANTGICAYPSNFLSRFYAAPVVGAKLQLMLTDPRFNFRDELHEFIQTVDYCSENGKTRGALAPNEFWYFWRRFLADPERDVWSDQELADSMDIGTLRAELAGLTDVFRKPFAAKCMLFNYNIRFIASLLDNAVFIRMQRDPVNNIQSILAARERQSGDVRQWYSFSIPEYDELKDLEPREQVAGQVFYINRAIDEGFQGLPAQNRMDVCYEDFCENPGIVYRELIERLAQNGYSTSVEYTHEKFQVTRPRTPDPSLIDAYRMFGD